MRTLGPGIALVLAACVSLPPPSTDKVRAAAFYESGIELRKKGEHDSAIRDFDEAIRLDPGSIDAYIDRGQSWRDRRNYEAALADFDEAIRLDPSHARAYVNRGYTWYRLGRYDQAIAEYDQAIHLGLRGAHYERGNAWLGKGDPERARADFSEAIRGDPRFALAYIGRGKAWKEAGDHDRAIEDYGEAIRLEPGASEAYYDRGSAWYAKHEYARALADFTEVIRLEPFHSGAYGGAAWLLASAPDAALRDGSRAVEFATRACEITGWTNPYLIQTLAIAYAEASDYPQATHWMEKALGFPEFAEQSGEEARARLALFRANQPYRESPMQRRN